MTRSIKLLSTTLFLSVLISSCNSSTTASSESADEEKVVNAKYSIASTEYEVLADEALQHIADFQFPELYNMVSDDIELYLPDGGEKSRTRFIGKEAFMGFWDTYEEKSGNSKMTYSNPVHVAINVHEKLNYTNISGVVVTSYFSLDMEYGEEVIDVRMNFAMHFNEDKKIAQIYAYYDRTPIIAAAKRNLLQKASE